MKATYIRARLETTAPLAVSAPEAAQPAPPGGKPYDLPLRRDRHGAPAVPSTTIAGSIRSQLAPELRPALMGEVHTSGEGRRRDTRTVASALHVLRVQVTPPPGAPSDGVTAA